MNQEELISKLDQIEEQPRSEYPIGIYADEVIVWQLGEFRESRALEGLRRIASFDPKTSESGFGRTRQTLVQLALEALEKIKHGPA